MQELQSSGKTDSELWKNCETRWLQLFHLVEKQCQEKIVAQQEQFHNQIQHIQEEIRNLVKLQTSNVSWTSCDRNSSSKQVSSKSQMGFVSENSERNESVTSYPEPKEPELQQEACMSQPDSSVDSSSVSSGYGTFCVSELNTYKSKGPIELMEHTRVSQGQYGTPVVQIESSGGGAERRTFYTQAPEEFCSSLKKENSTFPGEFEHSFLGENKISEVYSGKTKNSKSITSWAQKLKQNQPKRAQAEDGGSRLKQGPEQGRKPPVEKSDFAATPLPCSFYLSKPDESPNSWVSDSGTGLTYWKLEDKDMYHSLPEALEKALLSSSSAESLPGQSKTSNEMKLPSLKDIYHKKQRENIQLPERNLTSASNPNHPPEVLTLDPTLHRKPDQQISGTQPPGFLNARGDRISFSPDSVLQPSMSGHSDIDSFSQASNNASPLSGFPKYPSNMKTSPVDSWKNNVFQSESRTSSTFPSVYTITSNDISVNTVDEENTVNQSQLPGTANSVPECISLTSMEDPVVLSTIRQNLKEKHARHIADLRAYYESEINSLKQKLEAKELAAVEEWKKTNQVLIKRCGQLDNALNDATSHVRTLENKNNLLETELNDLRERFSAVSSASKILQERIEEMRTSSKEKDNTIFRLKSRLQDLEAEFENAYKLSDDKEARLKQENKMFQDLLGEYESLGKEHGQVKDTLNITENKLLDAYTQISDLKRMISKLEAQVKQVEHENMLNLRHNSKTAVRPSRANSMLATSDVSRRKWLIPGAEYSIFTGQPLDIQDRKVDNLLEEPHVPGYHSPPEKDSSSGSSSSSLFVKKQKEMPDTPIMKGLKEFDEGRILKNWGTQTEKEDSSVNSQHTESSLSASHSPEKCTQQRQKRQSPASQRSSSLPPSNRKSSTPTKREIMLTPVTVAYSPKRSPKENLSPGFNHLLSKNENNPIRFDILLDDLDTVPVSTLQRNIPRKQLQFFPLHDSEEKNYSEKATDASHSSSPEPLPNGVKTVSVRPTWEKTKSVSYEQYRGSTEPNAFSWRKSHFTDENESGSPGRSFGKDQSRTWFGSHDAKEVSCFAHVCKSLRFVAIKFEIFICTNICIVMHSEKASYFVLVYKTSNSFTIMLFLHLLFYTSDSHIFSRYFCYAQESLVYFTI